MLKRILPAAFLLLLIHSSVGAQRVYFTNGGELILSGANVSFDDQDVSTNMRFTMFFHTQQLVNFDLTNNIGLYTGIAIRNIGLITEDAFQNQGFLDIDNTHENWNKEVKIKRRSYSLGFPLALKLGSFSKHFFIYGGAEIEWMFHYKQKMFIDGNKLKFTEWASKRVNPWIPSYFAGLQFPGGINLKVKYYTKDFLNPNFRGYDFGEAVDYSRFGSSGIWFISLSFFLNRDKIKDMIETETETETTALR